MKCHDVIDLIQDLVNNDLSEATAISLHEHLSSCSQCRQEHERAQELDRAIAGLPREIEPGRDLWPVINSRLSHAQVIPFHQRRRALMATAAAACLMAAALIGFLMGRQQAPPQQAVIEPTVSSAQMASNAVPLAASLKETRYQLHRIVAERRASLSAETLATVDENLELIDHAITSIQAALDESPGDPSLERKLVFAYRQEINLLRRTAQLPSEL